jgi:hypothetical protein
MDTRAYTGIAATQVALIVGALLVGGFFTLKSADYTAKFLWNLARTVVIFLPMALAWFGLFSSMFFQDMNLAIPVIVGVCAVSFNFMIDLFVYKGFGQSWFGKFTSMFKRSPAVPTLTTA